jgi:hypothetical protein
VTGQEVASVDVLAFLTPLIVDFTASAEFASLTFVHPVIRRLEPGITSESSRGSYRPSAA